MTEMFIFGVIDNGIMIATMLVMAGIGGKTRESKSRFFSWMNPVVGAIIGGYLGNTFSDMAGAIPMGIGRMLAVGAGCRVVGVAFLVPGVMRRLKNA